jgi:hypothetical protein
VGGGCHALWVGGGGRQRLQKLTSRVVRLRYSSTSLGYSATRLGYSATRLVRLPSAHCVYFRRILEGVASERGITYICCAHFPQHMHIYI